MLVRPYITVGKPVRLKQLKDGHGQKKVMDAKKIYVMKIYIFPYNEGWSKLNFSVKNIYIFVINNIYIYFMKLAIVECAPPGREIPTFN